MSLNDRDRRKHWSRVSLLDLAFRFVLWYYYAFSQTFSLALLCCCYYYATRTYPGHAQSGNNKRPRLLPENFIVCNKISWKTTDSLVEAKASENVCELLLKSGNVLLRLVPECIVLQLVYYVARSRDDLWADRNLRLKVTSAAGAHAGARHMHVSCATQPATWEKAHFLLSNSILPKVIPWQALDKKWAVCDQEKSHLVVLHRLWGHRYCMYARREPLDLIEWSGNLCVRNTVACGVYLARPLEVPFRQWRGARKASREFFASSCLSS